MNRCKRLNRLGLHRLVLSKAGARVFAVKAKNWSESVHRFLKLCVNAGNVDACYTLGMVSTYNLSIMYHYLCLGIITNKEEENQEKYANYFFFLFLWLQIRFYCLQNRRSGLALMAKAAMKSHASALYSLAVIQFNGSGGSKREKDLRAGVALCARASLLGHIDALRELGHCLKDGYGVRQNIAEGRRLLVQANARELAFVIRSVTQASSSPSTSSSLLTWRAHRYQNSACQTDSICSLSDFVRSVPVLEVHPANWFLREWFESGPGVLEEGLRLCAHIGCGRSETRPHEFRRCSVCGKVNYCSRGCQALDWKLRHKMECTPGELWVEDNGGGGGGGAAGDDGADLANNAAVG